MGSWSVINIKTLNDERGSISVIENSLNFTIRRVYYLHHFNKNAKRGAHAHRNLNQILVVVSGVCTVKLNNGEKTEEFKLSEANVGLNVKGLVWRDIYEASQDCVLMVLADQVYDEKDYIRDYTTFLCAVGKSNVLK